MNDQAKDTAQPQKLSLQSAIPADEKLRQLQQLFPEAFAETQKPASPKTVPTLDLE